MDEKNVDLFVSKMQLAKILNMSERTIDRCCEDSYMAARNGKLTKRFIGRSVRFFLPEVFLALGINYGKFFGNSQKE
jgi:hypothetical protein